MNFQAPTHAPIPYFTKTLLNDEGLQALKSAWPLMAPHPNTNKGVMEATHRWAFTLEADDTVRFKPKKELTPQQVAVLYAPKLVDRLIEMSRSLALTYKQVFNVDLTMQGSWLCEQTLKGRRIPKSDMNRGVAFHDDDAVGFSITPVQFPPSIREGHLLLKPAQAPDHLFDRAPLPTTQIIPYKAGETVGWMEHDFNRVKTMLAQPQATYTPQGLSTASLLAEHGVQTMKPPSGGGHYQGEAQYWNPESARVVSDPSAVDRLILVSLFNPLAWLHKQFALW
jgi:hypothetical protein